MLSFLLDKIAKELKQFTGAIENSNELLEKIGEKNDFVLKLENVINNPIETTFSLSQENKKVLTMLIENKLRKELIKFSGDINFIKKGNFDNELVYFVSVNDYDNEEKKEKIWDVFYNYNTKNFSKEIPVLLQIIPSDFNKDSIFDCEDVILQ